MTLNITALWDALGWAVLHSLWQGALIGCLVWVARVLATDRHAWLRYLAGMSGLVATFVAFIATFIILIFERAQHGAPLDLAGGPETGSPAESTLSISVFPVQLVDMGLAEASVPWLGMIWAVGFAFLSLQAYRAYATTRWLATRGLQAPGPDWTSRFAVLIQRSRTHARVRLFISEHVHSPMTLGALRPIVLVPVGFLTALPPAQIEAILLHELGHIRRHDFFFGLIQTAIRTALYFNPAVIMMSRQIDEDREKACDDIAVSVSGSSRDLVRGLAALRLGHHAPAMVMAADGGPLLTRLNRLMGRPVSRSASSRLTAAAISALIVGTAACSTVSMAHPPKAQKAPDVAIPDTIIRASEDGPSRVFVSNTAPLPAMPVMPAVPAIPVMPAAPVPVVRDFESKEAFEEALEDWSDTIEVWSEEVERRFEGDWEDKMDVWGEKMEAWGDTVKARVAKDDLSGFEALAELGSLADLQDLRKLADLSELVPNIDIDGVQIDVRGDGIRDRILSQVEARLRASSDGDQLEWISEPAQAHAARKQEFFQEKQEFFQEKNERVQERAEETRRQAAYKRRKAEANAHAAKARQGATASSKAQSARHNDYTIAVSNDDPDKSIVINGRAVAINEFRTEIMTALVKDGLVKTPDQSVKLKLCEGDVIVNGQTGNKAQAKRYTKMIGAAGFDLDDTLIFKFKPDVMTLTASGQGQKPAQQISIGTLDHTSNK